MNGTFSLSSRSRVLSTVFPMAADGYCDQGSSKVLVIFTNCTASKIFCLRHDLELWVSFRSSFAVTLIFEYLNKSFSRVSGFSG